MMSKLFNSKLGGPLGNKFTTMIGCVGTSGTRMMTVSMPSKLVYRSGACGVHRGVVHTSIALDVRLPGLSFLFPRGRSVMNR